MELSEHKRNIPPGHTSFSSTLDSEHDGRQSLPQQELGTMLDPGHQVKARGLCAEDPWGGREKMVHIGIPIRSHKDTGSRAHMGVSTE